LHDGNVEPLVELAADLALDADQFEAARPVQGDRGIACGGDPGEHRMEPRNRRNSQQLDEDELADSPTVAVATHVDRVLDAGAVGGPLLVRRQRPEADDVAAFVGRIDGNDCCECTIAIGDPLLLIGQRSGNQVERRGRVGHLVVVDLADLLGVAQRCQSQSDRRRSALVHEGRA